MLQHLDDRPLGPPSSLLLLDHQADLIPVKGAACLFRRDKYIPLHPLCGDKAKALWMAGIDPSHRENLRLPILSLFRDADDALLH